MRVLGEFLDGVKGEGKGGLLGYVVIIGKRIRSGGALCHGPLSTRKDGAKLISGLLL